MKRGRAILAEPQSSADCPLSEAPRAAAPFPRLSERGRRLEASAGRKPSNWRKVAKSGETFARSDRSKRTRARTERVRKLSTGVDRRDRQAVRTLARRYPAQHLSTRHIDFGD